MLQIRGIEGGNNVLLSLLLDVSLEAKTDNIHRNVWRPQKFKCSTSRWRQSKWRANEKRDKQTRQDIHQQQEENSNRNNTTTLGGVDWVRLDEKEEKGVAVINRRTN